MQTPTPRFHEWLAAEKKAHAAERELYALMVKSSRDTSAPPLREQVDAARALRRRAHALFDDAMQEMKELSESLHHRRILTTEAPRESEPQRRSSGDNDPSASSHAP